MCCNCNGCGNPKGEGNLKKLSELAKQLKDGMTKKEAEEVLDLFRQEFPELYTQQMKKNSEGAGN